MAKNMILESSSDEDEVVLRNTLGVPGASKRTPQLSQKITAKGFWSSDDEGEAAAKGDDVEDDLGGELGPRSGPSGVPGVALDDSSEDEGVESALAALVSGGQTNSQNDKSRTNTGRKAGTLADLDYGESDGSEDDLLLIGDAALEEGRKMRAEMDQNNAKRRTSSASSGRWGEGTGRTKKKGRARKSVVVSGASNRRELDNPLKSDHAVRPLYVTERGQIFLEKFSPLYSRAYDFMIAVAEPVSRTSTIHEYKLTQHSLHAAVSVGFTDVGIIKVLSRLCKTVLSNSVKKMIRRFTKEYGHVRVVLKQQRFFLESFEEDVLDELASDQTIDSYRLREPMEGMEFVVGPNGYLTNVDKYGGVDSDGEEEGGLHQNRRRDGKENGNDDSSSGSETESSSDSHESDFGSRSPDDELYAEDSEGEKFVAYDHSFVMRGMSARPLEKGVLPRIGGEVGGSSASSSTTASRAHAAANVTLKEEEEANDAVQLGEDLEAAAMEKAGPTKKMVCFEVSSEGVELVRKRCLDMGFPAMEEYDFRNDTITPTLEMDLRPSTAIRPYQEKSLSKMFGESRARSGIIVLPCGAGKTLVGVTAACTIKKSTFVLCTSNIAVDQWKNQFTTWSTVPEKNIFKFSSSKEKDKGVLPSDPNEPIIVVSTYAMASFTQERKAENEKVWQNICDRDWGLIILDEVQVAPAEKFRAILNQIKAHCKLGLTATLVREDKKIKDLNFFLGPKLYEANWQDLVDHGYIANVKCSEVWCRMTPSFFSKYLQETNAHKRKKLYMANPNKFLDCHYLVHFHEMQGHRTLVFGDDIWTLSQFSSRIGRPFIHGKTPLNERRKVLEDFKSGRSPTVFISKIGDNSIDLPSANVLVQISSHYGSRRQEAQRLGRILRAKKAGVAPTEYNAFFYSLVSKDTKEMYYSSRRQTFLVAQGYAFHVETNLWKTLKGVMDIPDPPLLETAEQDGLLASVLEQEAELLDANGARRTNSSHTSGNSTYGRAASQNKGHKRLRKGANKGRRF